MSVCDIWAVPAAGGTPVNLTNTPQPVQEFNADYSPDGRRIVFERIDATSPEIAVMNPDGSGQTQVTATATVSERQPVFSPDGTRLALRRGTAGSSDIVTMALDGTDIRNVTNDGNAGVENDPAWEGIYTCGRQRATIVGDAGPDTIRGTKRADVIVANAGKDRIVDGRGNDRICGGPGKDRITGGVGKKDRCIGGGGKDKGGKGCEKGKL